MIQLTIKQLSNVLGMNEKVLTTWLANFKFSKYIQYGFPRKYNVSQRFIEDLREYICQKMKSNRNRYRLNRKLLTEIEKLDLLVKNQEKLHTKI